MPYLTCSCLSESRPARLRLDVNTTLTAAACPSLLGFALQVDSYLPPYEIALTAAPRFLFNKRSNRTHSSTRPRTRGHHHTTPRQKLAQEKSLQNVTHKEHSLVDRPQGDACLCTQRTCKRHGFRIGQAEIDITVWPNRSGSHD
jgi:hypothetical protein